MDNFAASTPAAGTIDCMPLAEIILTLADLCDDLVRASADLDDLAEGLLRPVS